LAFENFMTTSIRCLTRTRTKRPCSTDPEVPTWNSSVDLWVDFDHSGTKQLSVALACVDSNPICLRNDNPPEISCLDKFPTTLQCLFCLAESGMPLWHAGF
jgi:hypothetical protein